VSLIMPKTPKNCLLMIVIVAVVIGFLGFYGGVLFQKSKQGINPQGVNQGFPNGTQQQGGAGKQGNSTGSQPVSGEITKLDSSTNTITIKTQNGGNKLVIYSSSTKINTTSEGSVSDLKVGGQITAVGPTGSDGLVTAQSISLGNGISQAGGGMPGGNQSGQQPPQ
jgi:hypothetical protein